MYFEAFKPMETHKSGPTLLIKNEKDNLKISNYTETGGSEVVHVCKLVDIFANNINCELSKISILQLDNCDITEIPSNIQKLNLKQLVLTRNKLKEVPSCLYSGLQTLELLDLSHNCIKSFDVEPACSCTIATLRLNDNQIHSLPHWILTLRCPRLVDLNYSNNHVVELKTSHELKLQKLEIRNCDLLDCDFPFFKGIKSLEFLDISNESPAGKNENRFKDLDLLFFKPKWKNLSVLKLNNLCVSILPHGIFWIVSLTELHLVNCDLSWLTEDIQYLSDLKILDVSNNGICSLPSQLALLDNLVVIKAPFNNISSVPGFKHNLEILDLYDNYLDTVPSCIGNTKFIDIEHNLIDTETCPEYFEKRDRLRQMFSFVRTIGPREVENEQLSTSDTHSLYSESEEYVDYHDEVLDLNLESWDEEKPKPKVLYVRNPEVTASDDEWDGKDLNKEKEQSKQYSAYDVNEDWIFCDAAE